MNRVFGKKKAPGPPPPTLNDASSSISSQIDTLDSRILQLDKELKVYRDKLKVKTINASTKSSLQKRAMEVLKRKKMYENQRDQLTGQQFNIDQTSFGIESAKATVTTISAMKAASAEMKHTMKHELNITDVDELADDMAEMMDEFNEINEALASNWATPADIDEADLEAELDMLADELEEEETLLENSTTLPSYLQQQRGVHKRNSGVSAVIGEQKTTTDRDGRCPWPFVFFHDPAMGMRDWQTWFVIGLVLCWVWSRV
jgi:charged multivesicular body protein 5